MIWLCVRLLNRFFFLSTESCSSYCWRIWWRHGWYWFRWWWFWRSIFFFLFVLYFSVHLIVDLNDVIIFIFNVFLCEQMMMKKICLSTIWLRKQIHHLILKQIQRQDNFCFMLNVEVLFCSFLKCCNEVLQVVPVPVLALDQTARVLNICSLRYKYTFWWVKDLLMMLVCFNLKICSSAPSGFRYVQNSPFLCWRGEGGDLLIQTNNGRTETKHVLPWKLECFRWFRYFVVYEKHNIIIKFQNYHFASLLMGGCRFPWIN